MTSAYASEQLTPAYAHVYCGGSRRRLACRVFLGELVIDGERVEWRFARPRALFRARADGGWAVRCDGCGREWTFAGHRARTVVRLLYELEIRGAAFAEVVLGEDLAA